ncbi:hypothetical protein [Chryseobacterium sp. G0201]|uniref:hypothetical protein n=1 Tax=Chryseobacterium sp. G0201 TaxID=2487065 RepID=UPI000F502CB0|nr:hypothetical protein [Chryseobacterium sp. G0201]AZA54061.1 hypothetical protein EG348_14160 [Chryseobacterium sp. G0201]
MKNLFFSAFVVLIGTGAAFASSKADNSKSAIVDGYHFDAEQGICLKADQPCSDIVSIQFCEWTEDGSVLREMGETVCGNPLYRVAP